MLIWNKMAREHIESDGMVHLFKDGNQYIIQCVSIGTNWNKIKNLSRRHCITLGPAAVVSLENKKATQEIKCKRDYSEISVILSRPLLMESISGQRRLKELGVKYEYLSQNR
jgi:hypothetical protein